MGLQRWEYSCALVTSGKDFIRYTPNEKCNGGDSSQQLRPSVAEINRNIQPPQGAQIILTQEVAIPGHKGCGSAIESSSGTQCWVCQDQDFRNGILYSSERVLEVNGARLSEDRKELKFDIINDNDGLSSVKCTSKKSIAVKGVEDFEGLLKASGLQYHDPGFIVKASK